MPLASQHPNADTYCTIGLIGERNGIVIGRFGVVSSRCALSALFQENDGPGREGDYTVINNNVPEATSKGLIFAD